MRGKAFLWLAFSLPLVGFGQRVIEIKLEGLKKTKENYVQLFISTRTGDPYDSLKAEQDRQRLANLEIMRTVSLEKSINQDGIRLTFHFKEMVNTIPIFALGKTRETFWCRAGAQANNLGGNGGKLIAYYQYYDRHSAFVSYTQPWVKNKPVGFSGTFIRWATLEPVAFNQSQVTYSYGNLSGSISGLYHFGFRESLELGVQSFKEHYLRIGYTAEPMAPESYYRKGGLVKGIFRSNRINYSTFYLKGFSYQLNTELIKRTGDGSLFFIAFHELKYFKRVGTKGNLASRLRMGLSTNEASPFAPFVLDSYLNIRGVGNRVDRGTGSIVANLEYRQTIFDKKYFAAQTVAFTDFGSWRKPGGKFSDFAQSINMKAFSGLGLRIIYKGAFDTLLRIDYGFDYNHQGGLVIGIGQYF